MRMSLLSLFCCVALWQVQAADEQFIPAALNVVLPKIHAEMSVQKVEAILSRAYPNVKDSLGPWSGDTGYIEYDLDGRFTLSVAFMLNVHGMVVDDNLLFSVDDNATKHRWDIKSYDYGHPSKRNNRGLSP